MNVTEVSIMPHLGIVLLLLQLYSAFRSRDPTPYFTSFLYLSWIHTHYVKAFWKKLERANGKPSKQREIWKQRQERRMQLSYKDKQRSCHLLVVLFLLWFLSALSCCHWAVYFILFLYLYWVLADSEILRLLNYVTEMQWPKYLEEIASKKIFQPIVDWFLEKYRPSTLKKALVQWLSLGNNPPTFTEVHVFRNSDSNEGLVIELGINFSADDHMHSILAIKLRNTLGLGMLVKLKMTNLYVDGKVLIVVNFSNHWPFVRRLQVCFVEPPFFSMTVKPLPTCGLDIIEPPGIVRRLDELLSVAVEKMLVWPSTLTLDMERYAATCTDSCFFLDVKEPVACVRVGDIKASKLNPPWFPGSVDWYVKVRLGNRIFRSRTQRTQSPCWDEEYKIPVTTWESLDKIIVEVCYKGFLGDKTYGWSSLDRNAVRDGRSLSMTLPLRNNKRQYLHLSVASVAVPESNVRALSSVPRVKAKTDLQRINLLEVSGDDFSGSKLMHLSFSFGSRKTVIFLKKNCSLKMKVYNHKKILKRTLNIFAFWNTLKHLLNQLGYVGYAKVEVIEALVSQGSIFPGSIDPYVMGQMGPHRFRTKTQHKTEAPKWHEEFRVPILRDRNILHMEVRNKRHLGDYSLGSCGVNMNLLVDGERHDNWLPLEDVWSGKLHIAITVTVFPDKQVKVSRFQREYGCGCADLAPLNSKEQVLATQKVLSYGIGSSMIGVYEKHPLERCECLSFEGS